MGFRFQRRINLGGGAGLNLSKSGVSTSVRSRFASVGTRGFSIRTGIPGLTYRNYGRKGSDAGLIVLLVLGAAAVLAVILQVLLLAVVGAARAAAAGAKAIRRRSEQGRLAKELPALPPPSQSSEQKSDQARE